MNRDITLIVILIAVGLISCVGPALVSLCISNKHRIINATRARGRNSDKEMELKYGQE